MSSKTATTRAVREHDVTTWGAPERVLAGDVREVSAAALLSVVASLSLDAAAAFLGHYNGSLSKIAGAVPSELETHGGIGRKRAAQVVASFELGRRYAAEQRPEGASIRAPKDVVELVGLQLRDVPVEEFHVLLLDAQYRLQRDVLVTRGILNQSVIHPREVFRQAIADRAFAVILVHNHPSGDPTPSTADAAVTADLVAAGKLLDIPVTDHVIIGHGRYVSFAEAGLL